MWSTNFQILPKTLPQCFILNCWKWICFVLWISWAIRMNFLATSDPVDGCPLQPVKFSILLSDYHLTTELKYHISNEPVSKIWIESFPIWTPNSLPDIVSFCLNLIKRPDPFIKDIYKSIYWQDKLMGEKPGVKHLQIDKSNYKGLMEINSSQHNGLR